MFYVERLKALALEAFLSGVSAFLILERTNLHPVILLFLRRLHVNRVMLLLQAAGNRQRVVLLQSAPPPESRTTLAGWQARS